MAMLTANCGGHGAESKIVATVNGQQLTMEDVRAAAAASNLDIPDSRSAQSAAIRNLINLKLLAQQAKLQGLNAAPETLALIRHAQDEVLALTLISHWSKQIPQPSPDEIRQFIETNPQIFSQRKLYSVDQIETDQRNLGPDELEPLRSMNDVVHYLRLHNREFHRRSSTLDTMTLRVETAREIASLAPGEPFVANAGGKTIVRSITGSAIASVPEDQRAPLAIAMLRKQHDLRFVSRQLVKLRENAHIEYESGIAL